SVKSGSGQRGSEPLDVVEAARDVAAFGVGLAFVTEDRPYLLLVVEADDKAAAHRLEEGRLLDLLQQRDALFFPAKPAIAAAAGNDEQRACAAAFEKLTPRKAGLPLIDRDHNFLPACCSHPKGCRCWHRAGPRGICPLLEAPSPLQDLDLVAVGILDEEKAGNERSVAVEFHDLLRIESESAEPIVLAVEITDGH